jgi:hypothetical protein
MSTSKSSPWVQFLRCYGPIPTNDNMYDETIQRALRRHKVTPLTLPVQWLGELLANFQSERPVSYILTGTAGDGKTYHCREVWTGLGGSLADWNSGKKIQTINLPSRQTLIVIKDLTELKDTDALELVKALAVDVAAEAPKCVYLIAANHGQLLDRLKAALPNTDVATLLEVVEDLMVAGREPERGIKLRLRDLSRSLAAETLDKIVQAVTEHDGWAACSSCSHNNDGAKCPILVNRARLAGENGSGAFARRLASLVELSEHNGYHFPIRQLLVLVANILLGHPDARDGLMTCADVGDIAKRGTADMASPYRNVFGENLKPSRAERTEPFVKLSLFGIGLETSNAIDNILVFGADDPKLEAVYQDYMISDPVYGATPSFSRAQRDYLEGREEGADSRFLALLRSQRQRLFFELPERDSEDFGPWDLTIFKHAGEFLDLIAAIGSQRAAPREALPMIVRGLNRVFSGMLAQNQDELVLATSGTHSQTRTSPMLEEMISVPRKSGEEVLLAAANGHGVCVTVRFARDGNPPPVSLKLTPTRFEFLGRVADGALPSSFSLECHEDFLAFKALLLSAAQDRKRLDQHDDDERGDLILQFLDLGHDGRAVSRRVTVKL